MKKKILHVIAYVLFILFTVIIILPLIWMAVTGFKTNQEMFLAPFSLPEQWVWQNYVDAWNQGIGIYLKQRCYYGYGNGFIYICELSGGISAGKAEFQEQKGVGISDSGGPDVSAPVVGNLSV